MFNDFDLASTMLQVASGLAGLTLVSTGFIPLIAERAQGQYEAFVAQSKISMLIKLTKLSFTAFVLSVILSLSWCILLDLAVYGWMVSSVAIGCFITFVIGIGLTTYIVLGFFKYDTFSER